jgi:hypothetical protein
MPVSAKVIFSHAPNDGVIRSPRVITKHYSSSDIIKDVSNRLITSSSIISSPRNNVLDSPKDFNPAN